MKRELPLRHTPQRDTHWQAEVDREIVRVLAAREEHSLVANLLGWIICVLVATSIGLSAILVCGLVLRLVAIAVTRACCDALRKALAEGRPYRKPLRHAQLALASSGFSWAMLTWPLLDGSAAGTSTMAMLAIVIVGVCLICSLVGLSLPVLLGFTAIFASSVLLGSIVMQGFVDLSACIPILLPLLGATPFGLGTRKQAIAAARDAVDIRYLGEELATSLHHAEFLSQHDPLTGLLNRRALLEGRNRTGARAHVIAFDLDHFKSVNDRFGHQAGDDVLVRTAEVLRRHARVESGRECLAGRVGGEEFLLILTGATNAEALHLAEAIRRDVASIPASKNDRNTRISASIGIARWLPEEPLSNALSRADQALYKAKRRGRNAVEFHEADTLAA